MVQWLTLILWGKAPEEDGECRCRRMNQLVNLARAFGKRHKMLRETTLKTYHQWLYFGASCPEHSHLVTHRVRKYGNLLSHVQVGGGGIFDPTGRVKVLDPGETPLPTNTCLFILRQIPNVQTLVVSPMAFSYLASVLKSHGITFKNLHTLRVQGKEGIEEPSMSIQKICGVVHSLPKLACLAISGVQVVEVPMGELPIPVDPPPLSSILLHGWSASTSLVAYLLQYAKDVTSIDYRLRFAQSLATPVHMDLDALQAALAGHSHSLESCTVSVQGQAYPLTSVHVKGSLDFSAFPSLKWLDVATHFMDAGLLGDGQSFLERLPREVHTLHINLTHQRMNEAFGKQEKFGRMWSEFPRMHRLSYGYDSSEPIIIQPTTDWTHIFQANSKQVQHSVEEEDGYFYVADVHL